MKKVSWDLYSKRRRVSLQTLYNAGKIQSYEQFIDYCNRFSITPLEKSVYEQETSSFLVVSDKIDPKKTAQTPPTSKVSKDETCCDGRHSTSEHADAQSGTSEHDQTPKSSEDDRTDTQTLKKTTLKQKKKTEPTGSNTSE